MKTWASHFGWGLLVLTGVYMMVGEISFDLC